MEPNTIDIRNAREHNLRSVSLSLPRNALIVFTGVSGSGKSSLAFDTLYAEGQRRYIESLSSYARQFMGQMAKPDCDLITGLSPAVAIQQISTGWNPRSTVGTVTAIYDFLRVLYARIGVQHCTRCGRPISAQSRDQIVAGILAAFAPDSRVGGPSDQSRDRKGAVGAAPIRAATVRERSVFDVAGRRDTGTKARRVGIVGSRDQGIKDSRTGPAVPTSDFRLPTSDNPKSKIQNPKSPRVLVLAPVARAQKGEFRDLFDDLLRAGYVRARVDGVLVELRDDLALERNRRHDIEVVIDRIALDDASRSRLAEAVENALKLGDGAVLVTPSPASGEGWGEGEPLAGPGPGSTSRSRRNDRTAERIFSSKYACTRCGTSFEPPTPQMFSFNSPAGMCPTCDGLGERFDFDPDLLVPDPSLNFLAPCIAPMRTRIGRWRRHIYQGVADAVGFDLRTPWKDLPQNARDALLHGTGDRHITYTWRWSGGVWRHGGTFDGVVAELRDKYRKAKAQFVRNYYEKYMRRGPCPDCRGARLNPQALAVRLKLRPKTLVAPVSNRWDSGGLGRALKLTGPRGSGRNIQELCTLSVQQAHDTVARLSLTPVQHQIVDEVLKEVRTRLEFLLNVGLHYLTLDRSAPSLSGGESQRIRLAGQIGSGLAGVLYVLDEPSIGLHARDNARLLASLQALRDMGNTVIVVEHDEATMRAADHVVDFGPGPGVRGGMVVAMGTLEGIIQNKASLTGRYLAGESEIAVPTQRRPVRSEPRLRSEPRP